MKLNEDQLINHAKTVYQTSSVWRGEVIEQRWKTSQRLYDSKFDPIKGEKAKSDVLLGQGRLFIPKTYSHVQRILCDLLDTYFFDLEEIVSVASCKDVSYESRQIVKTLLNYRLNGHPIDFYFEAYEACLDALKSKIGIFKVFPDIRYTTIDFGGTKFKMINEFHPVITCLPYEDVFFDKRATWKDYHLFPIIHRFIKTRDELRQMGYKNIEELKALTVPSLNDMIKEDRELDQGTGFMTLDEHLKGLDPILVYEIWTFLPLEGDGNYKSCSYLMAGDSTGPHVIIRDVEENTLPYKRPGDMYNRPPILVGNSFPEPHMMYGKDLPEIVEGLQRETNAQRNQRREAVALSLRKPILANKSAGIDLMALVNRKIGSVVLGDDVSEQSVRELQVSDPSAATIQEQAKTDQDFYETTSIPPNMLGMASQRDETATAVTAHVANANKKIAQIVRNLAYTLFLPALRMLLRLEQEYETDEFVAMVTGKQLGWGFGADGAPPKESIQGDFDLTINVGVNKQAQLNKWLLIMDRANLVNATTTQMLQIGAVQAENVNFVDTSKLFDVMIQVLGEKNLSEFRIKAMQPPPPQTVKGQASQPGMNEAPETAVSNMNAEVGLG